MSKKQKKQTGKRGLAWICGLIVVGGLALYNKAIFERFGWPYPAWLSAFNGWLDLAVGTSLLYLVSRNVSANELRNRRT